MLFFCVTRWPESRPHVPCRALGAPPKQSPRHVLPVQYSILLAAFRVLFADVFVCCAIESLDVQGRWSGAASFFAARGCTVGTMALTGRGSSPTETLSLRALQAGVAAAVEKSGLTPPVVIAHSMAVRSVRTYVSKCDMVIS